MLGCSEAARAVLFRLEYSPRLGCPGCIALTSFASGLGSRLWSSTASKLALLCCCCDGLRRLLVKKTPTQKGVSTKVTEAIVEKDSVLPLATLPEGAYVAHLRLHLFPKPSLSAVVLIEPNIFVHLFGFPDAGGCEERQAQLGIRFAIHGRC